MGYKLPKLSTTVAFEEGHTYHGLTMELSRSVPVGIDFVLARLSKDAEKDGEPFVRGFAEHVLVSWNLEEDDGTPIPATPDGLLGALPVEVLMDVFQQWKESRGVAAPLDQPSSDTGTSPVPLMRTASG